MHVLEEITLIIIHEERGSFLQGQQDVHHDQEREEIDAKRRANR